MYKYSRSILGSATLVVMQASQRFFLSLRPGAEPEASGEMRPAGDTANLAYRRCGAADLINITV